jgi:hypothetical protein
MAGLVIEERAWYVHEAGAVIGILTFDTADLDWGYVILGRDEAGEFRGIKVEHSMRSPREARQTLLEQMQQFVESGQTVFPQD